MEKDMQYLMELAVLEVLYGDLDNEQLPKEPDEVQCTRSTWLKLVQNAPSLCANSLAILTWKDGERVQQWMEQIASGVWYLIASWD
ncbi:hypothetical protein QYF61_006767 [Mycteria americana]|uniref:Uncharacterized protein n=1 Tax=Mycteria americana TaxID=33587 RepID=A0AAN7MY15_MYCAM|nr:hypothetical protein QYF61_006767 [Mycteria americana]